MAACDTGKTILYIRSILWDLDIPQEAATILYEDNDGCTAMGNAQKPTTQTCHINIKYFSLCNWVERNLIILDPTDTLINMADHLTKALQPTLYHRHADFLLGHIPPAYSPLYTSMIGDFPNHTPNIDKYNPINFTNTTGSTINIVHQYGQINMVTLQTQCEAFCKNTGTLFQARARQNNTMMSKCIMKMLTPAARVRLLPF